MQFAESSGSGKQTPSDEKAQDRSEMGDEHERRGSKSSSEEANRLAELNELLKGTGGFNIKPEDEDEFEMFLQTLKQKKQATKQGSEPKQSPPSRVQWDDALERDGEDSERRRTDESPLKDDSLSRRQ